MCVSPAIVSTLLHSQERMRGGCPDSEAPVVPPALLVGKLRFRDVEAICSGPLASLPARSVDHISAALIVLSLPFLRRSLTLLICFSLMAALGVDGQTLLLHGVIIPALCGFLFL